MKRNIKIFIKRTFIFSIYKRIKKIYNFILIKFKKIYFIYNIMIFVDYLYSNTQKSNNYIKYQKKEIIQNKKIKIICFYLPQFHEFKENNIWWGKHFTEWTNVTRAIPLFYGHHQPQLPSDIGFYDLTKIKTFYEQIEIAKNYGIYGFCFYYYWFSGKKLMDTPINIFLNNTSLDINFCLCWANESWTRTWDGENKNILIKQSHSSNDYINFFKDIHKYISDKRYIKIDNKPILIIYRADLFEKKDMILFLKNLDIKAKENGFSGMYYICALACGFEGPPADWGFDAAVEFPPHGMQGIRKAKDIVIYNKDFVGNIYDMSTLNFELQNKSFNTFKCVFPSWDNTARRPNSSDIFINMTPDLYYKWIYDSMKKTMHSNNKFIFINAWNEWAEGAHLEPDRRYGYSYLEKTYQALITINNEFKYENKH